MRERKRRKYWHERGNTKWRQEMEKRRKRRRRKRSSGSQGEGPSNLHPATAPDFGEELIINLLSPSPNATASLTRPPSLHFHLRLLPNHPLRPPPLHGHHLHSHFVCPSTLALLPFPFFPILSFLPPVSLRPSAHVAPAAVCLWLRLLALSLSPLTLRGSRLRFRSRPIDLQTLSLLSVYLKRTRCDARRRDA